MNASEKLLAEAQLVVVEVGQKGIVIWNDYVIWLKLGSILLSVIFLAVIIYVVINMFKMGAPREEWLDLVGLSTVDNKRVLRAWAKIIERMKTGQEAEMKLAIIEADQILDEILKVSGYTGKTMADRLGQLSSVNLSNIEMVWRAHKVRNRLVHEADYSISRVEVEEYIKVYEKAFKEFKLLHD